MFSQDDFDSCPPREFDRSQANGMSPVRKKRIGGRLFQFISSSQTSSNGEMNRSQDEGDSLPPSSMFFSQESSSMSQLSQLSQDFADRLGQMHVNCSQDGGGADFLINNDSMASFDRFTMPTAPSTKVLKTAVKPKNPKKTSSQESEKQIDLRPVHENPFYKSFTSMPEQYFSKIQSNVKRPKKLWISSFKDRPRYLTDFEEVSVLGEGTFSVVTCVRHRLDGSLYAIKKIKEKIQSESHGKLMLRESCAFSALQGCPNLVQYYNSWIDDQHLYIQLELCHIGSLEDLLSNTIKGLDMNTAPMRERADSFVSDMDYLSQEGNFFRADSFTSQKSIPSKKSKSTLQSNKPQELQVAEGINEDLAWLILQEVSQTLNFMHQKGLVHLDLRPANIFIQSNPNPFESLSSQPSSYAPPAKSLFGSVVTSAKSLLTDDTPQMPPRQQLETSLISKQFRIKVGDLGHCRATNEKGIIIEGESRYCPRELIDSDHAKLDLTKADIFSLGATIYELCLGRFLGSVGEEGVAEWHSIR